MKALLFAPNGGASVSTGGGTKVLLRLADAFVRLYRCDVTVAGYHALSPEELERIHGIPLRGRSIAVVSAGGQGLFRGFRTSPVKLSAYNLLAAPSFAVWVRDLLRRSNADVIGFQDDVPKAAASAWRDARSFLYVHFPLAARTPRVIPPLRRTRNWTERWNDRWLRSVASGIVLDRPDESGAPILCNSTVTERAIRAVWPAARPTILPPAVDAVTAVPAAPRRAAEILAVGTFSRGKGFETLVDVLARPEAADWRLRLAGHPREGRYLARLRRRARRLQVRDRVAFSIDAGAAEIAAWRHAASVVAQAAEFEPLGLALLEGMRDGGVPFIRRSEYSGGWTDVAQRGRHGIAFDTPDDFAAELQRIPRERDALSADAMTRAQDFSVERFDDRLQGLGLVGR
jgi:glycosyltransferase involved in cell wall biosynthesis